MSLENVFKGTFPPCFENEKWSEKHFVLPSSVSIQFFGSVSFQIVTNPPLVPCAPLHTHTRTHTKHRSTVWTQLKLISRNVTFIIYGATY